MSSIAISGSAPTALPQVNNRPHGHKHGGRIESTDDSSSDTAAQIPVGAAQNAFGSLLQSLEQVIGVQTPADTTSASGATSTTASSTSTALTAATGAGANTASAVASTASTQLQSYLHNAAQSVQPNTIRLNV